MQDGGIVMSKIFWLKAFFLKRNNAHKGLGCKPSHNVFTSSTSGIVLVKHYDDRAV